jgi:SAM-dependent methyltransferase
VRWPELNVVRADAWDGYVNEFHRQRPGITDLLLRRARHEGLDPYEWCAEPLNNERGVVLDVACGSGPVAAHVSSWVGVDRSEQELRGARAARRGPVIRAAAQALPLPAAAVASAVSAMSLQILVPLDQAMFEIARVVRPGGRVVCLLPARRPLPWRDVVLYLTLQLRLRRSISYPNDHVLARRRLGSLASLHGFEVIDDQQAAFSLPLTATDDAEEFVRSLYLPNVAEVRVAEAAAVIRRRVGHSVTIPLRRVVLSRIGPSGCEDAA